MKIVYLVESKFCKRDFDRFGLKTLEGRGYKDIEVWDFSAWFRPHYYRTFFPKDAITGGNYKSVSSSREARNLLEQLPNKSLFIFIFKPNIKSILIFNYLHANNHLYGFLSIGHYPCHSVLSRVKQILREPAFLIEKLVNSIVVKAYSLVSQPIEADFVILGGSISGSPYIGINTTLLKAHTLDYDLFLSSDNDSKIFSKGIVFLDDYGPYHPDSTNRFKVNASNYYATLNRFFDALELNLGMEIVIAPHPRSDYESKGNPFNGRIISKLSTIQTVKNASVVISHASTAINFAVLFNKPILFMSNSFYPSYSREISRHTANFFNKRVLDVSASELNISDSDLEIDHKIYKSYKELYIKKSGTPEKPVWEIFADYLDFIA